jgi:hypothetical protein
MNNGYCSNNPFKKFKFFWMAEPGHPPEPEVLHKSPLRGGPTSLCEKQKKAAAA